jgi:S-adenosylmethionine:tRNA ribosyltransferase-isomerase
MIAAGRPDRRSIRLLHADAGGGLHHRAAADLAALFRPGDVVVINDAATLPASLRGTHVATGLPVEIRLAAWVRSGDPTRFVAIAFGEGDHRTRTEHRPAGTGSSWDRCAPSC